MQRPTGSLAASPAASTPSTRSARALPSATVVTGAAGWLGRALIHHLADPTGDHPRGGTIRALVLDEAEARAVTAVSSRVETVIGSVTDPSSLTVLLAGLADDTDVIHTAGVIHPPKVADFFAVNAEGTANVAAAAHRKGIRRLVHVSSNSPFGVNASAGDVFRASEPYNPYLGYGESKMRAELSVREHVGSGLDAVIVRPPWFYGPPQPPRQTTFFRLVRTGRFPRFGDGEQRRSMVFVDNLVDGIVRAELTEGISGRGYWIADARAYTVNEIIETVGRALRDEGYDVKDGSLRLPVIAGRIAERADRLIQKTGRYQQQLHVMGEMARSIACDITASRLDLGYEPTVELYGGMRASIQWCRREGIEL
ncbi:MAG: NAD(P)-dependent oxidoreductase [Ilumatobacteraceae bacterium]